jgi:DNA replication protein DnaC
MSPDERRRAEHRAWLQIAEKEGIAARYRAAAFETSSPTPALTATRDFLEDDENEGRCLVLAGPPGRGKTWCAHCAYRRVRVWETDQAAFFSMRQLVRALLDEEARDETFDRCRQDEFLVIDDVGGAYVREGGFVEGALEEILVEREAERLQTVLTTNATVTRFAELVGDRVMDRLKGDWGHWVSLPGESLRRKGRRAATQ